MKNKELFHKSVNILVDAYFNDTLEHGNCYACAVGNLVAANMGLHYTKCKQLDKHKRFALLENDGIYFETDDRILIGGNWYQPDEHKIHFAEKEIKSTGYGKRQIIKIEEAFESAYKGNSEDDYMLNGLMAVVDCLIEIHEGNEEEKVNAKKQFERVCN